MEVAPNTEAFKQAAKSGRLRIQAVNLTNGKVAHSVIVYGHTGGGRNYPKAAVVTNTLLRIAHDELDAQLKGPKFIASEFNADVANLPLSSV